MSTVGSVLGERWELVAPIGGGAMGTVWRARDRRGGADVAVKLMTKATRGLASFEERFTREAKSCAAVRHPNVVEIVDHGTTEAREPYLVMELLDGESLGARIERPPLARAREVIGWAIEVLAGLEAVHAAGIVHRDLKPDNVFLSAVDGDRIVVKLVDFGVSLAGGGADWDLLTRSGEVLGTTGYMAPEQRASAHDVDGRADLYSVGIVLYEALCGRTPFDGNNLGERLVAAAAGRAEPLVTRAPALGGALSDIVMRALAREPSERFADARSMREALLAARGDVPEDAVCLANEMATAMAAREARTRARRAGAEARPLPSATAQTRTAPTFPRARRADGRDQNGRADFETGPEPTEMPALPIRAPWLAWLVAALAILGALTGYLALAPR